MRSTGMGLAASAFRTSLQIQCAKSSRFSAFSVTSKAFCSGLLGIILSQEKRDIVEGPAAFVVVLCGFINPAVHRWRGVAQHLMRAKAFRQCVIVVAAAFAAIHPVAF